MRSLRCFSSLLLTLNACGGDDPGSDPENLSGSGGSDDGSGGSEDGSGGSDDGSGGSEDGSGGSTGGGENSVQSGGGSGGAGDGLATGGRGSGGTQERAPLSGTTQCEYLESCCAQVGDSAHRSNCVEELLDIVEDTDADADERDADCKRERAYYYNSLLCGPELMGSMTVTLETGDETIEASCQRNGLLRG